MSLNDLKKELIKSKSTQALTKEELASEILDCFPKSANAKISTVKLFDQFTTKYNQEQVWEALSHLESLGYIKPDGITRVVITDTGVNASNF